MSLKEQLKRKSASLVRRETLTLPATGLVVQVRGMMTGEATRLSELSGQKQMATMLALVTEDPETNEPVWNANNAVDHLEIAELPIADSTAIMDTANRLSGLSAEGKGEQSGAEPLITRSPSDSAEPSQS